MAPASESMIAAWTRVGAAALAAWGDAWARSCEIGARHLAGLGAAAGSPAEGRAWLRHVAPELVTVPWLALDRFAAELAAAAPGPSPGDDSRVVEGRTLLFPVRTMEASQGFALYPVPMTAAQRLLDERLGGHFAAVDVGRARAAVEVYVMDCRASDLGRYLEFGVGIVAAPRRNPLALGLCVLEEPVNDRFACRAGIEGWGFAKSECRLDVAPRGDAGAWRVMDPGTGSLLATLVLPRGGGGASADIPLRFYTVFRDAPYLVPVRRTGRGERLRAGGEGVALTVGGAGAGHPLAATLRALGLETSAPMLHGWTEHVSVEVGAPRPLSLSPPPGPRTSPRS